MDRVGVGEETTRTGNSRDRVEQRVDERKGEGERKTERERERTASSRRGGLNLISEKRVDTATAGFDRVIRTTLSLPHATCYVSYVHKAASYCGRAR